MSVVNHTDKDSDTPSMSTSELILRFDAGGPTKRVTIDIPPSLHALLKQAAARENRFLRDISVDAFVAYLRKNHPNLL